MTDLDTQITSIKYQIVQNRYNAGRYGVPQNLTIAQLEVFLIGKGGNVHAEANQLLQNLKKLRDLEKQNIHELKTSQFVSNFPVTVRTAIDEELTRSQEEVEARRILDVIAIQEETIRRTAVKEKIQEEAARLSREVISKEAYEFSEKEKALDAERAHLQWLVPQQISSCSGRSVDLGACASGKISEARLAEVGKELGVLREEMTKDFQAHFIIQATLREEAKRAEERSAAEQTLLNIEMAKESERQRMIQEESEQRELQLEEENIRMAAIAAEQRQAEKAALATVQTFRVEEPQPVTVQAEPYHIGGFPMLLVGGAALLLLARRK